jgi:aldose 1-epimerase
MKRIAAFAAFLGVAMALPAEARQYDARRNADVIRLEDTRNQTVVSIITSIGNIAYEMKVKGQDVLRFPFSSIDDFRSRQAGLHGIPLLAPWANRLDEEAFYANGKRYPFDMQLGNIKGPIPIHGFMSRTDQWQVVDIGANGASAWVTSRLDTSKQPTWIRQFPFAYTLDMMHRLQDGTLEVSTRITSMAAEPMPVSLGYHPYFQLTDSPRDEWIISVPARTRWLLSRLKLPTGETEAADRLFPNGRGTLRDHNLDDVFGDLVRDAQGRATVTLKGKRQQLEIVQGANYRSLVIYSPKPSDFICVEPMAGITNAMNLAHKGVYQELQYIEPGGVWQESFWVKPSGF